MNLFTLDTGWQSFPSPGPKPKTKKQTPRYGETY